MNYQCSLISSLSLKKRGALLLASLCLSLVACGDPTLGDDMEIESDMPLSSDGTCRDDDVGPVRGDDGTEGEQLCARSLWLL